MQNKNGDIARHVEEATSNHISTFSKPHRGNLRTIKRCHELTHALKRFWHVSNYTQRALFGFLGRAWTRIALFPPNYDKGLQKNPKKTVRQIAFPSDKRASLRREKKIFFFFFLMSSALT